MIILIGFLFSVVTSSVTYAMYKMDARMQEGIKKSCALQSRIYVPAELEEDLLKASYKPPVKCVKKPITSWGEKHSIQTLGVQLQGKRKKAQEFVTTKDDELATAITIMAYLPGNPRNTIVEYLLPQSSTAQARFVNDSIISSLSHYSASEALVKNKINSQSIEIYFPLSIEQKEILFKMYHHFSQNNNTSIQMSKKDALTVNSLPESTKEGFKNNKRFFMAEIMPDTSDKVRRVVSEVARGALIGAGTTVAITCASDLACNNAYAVRNAIAEGLYNGAQQSFIANISDSETRDIAKSSALSTLRETYNPIAAAKEGINVFGQKVVENTVIDLCGTVTTAAINNISITKTEDFKTTARYAGHGALVGGTVGGLLSLPHINEPVRTEFISEM